MSNTRADRSVSGANVGLGGEALRIQEWLSPLEPHARHQYVRNRRLDGVGDWVLQRNEFESWSKGKDGSGSPTLLCYGDQGVGKTYISSLVIDTLSERVNGQNMAVLSLYCDYQAREDQSAVNMIGGLLRQVALGAVGMEGEIRNAFEKSRQGGGKGLRLGEMVQLFIKAIVSLERVYICVDAIDELLPQHRSDFLPALRQIIQEAPGTRLFLTGRPHIRGGLDKHLTKGAYIIHIVPDQGDIVRYLSWKMGGDDDWDPDLMTENLKGDIMKTILEKASEMFLLVALSIDAILGEISLAKRRKMLQRVATTGVDLGCVYAQTLQRIRDQKGSRSRLGMEVLMWVSHAKRPLRIDELCHALAVDIDSTDLDLENITPPDTVLGSCLGLAVVNSETSTVRPIHYTLQEYLSQPGVLPNAHGTLGQTCLTYLNYDHVKRLPADNAPNLEAMPFLEYSSLHWGEHAKMELPEHTKSLVLELLSRYDSHISSRLLFHQIHNLHHYPLGHRPFPGLHCASYIGIDEAVAALIEMEGCDINRADRRGFTPLMLAVQQGNQGTVALLLTRDDIDPDKPDNHGRTALSGASSNGHEGVVRLLLARDDVNPDKPDNHGRTPLWRASYNGHEGVVRLLLARGDVNPDTLDHYDRTPLGWASTKGYEGVVRLLLARGDVNPNLRDVYRRTLLGCASIRGHEGVVRLLLQRDDVNPNVPDYCSRTPLWWASFKRHEGVVRALLARGNVDPDKADISGATPLWLASSDGCEGIVRLLLARDDVNPDKPDHDGKTLLWWASFHGREGVAKLLLARNDVDPNKQNDQGQTPLWCASDGGHEGVVKLLLARDGVDSDKPDNNGRTPLWGASRSGHEEVVRLLLARDDINPDKPDNDGFKPLWWASVGGHEGVVRLLLARDGVNPASRTTVVKYNWGSTLGVGGRQL